MDCHTPRLSTSDTDLLALMLACAPLKRISAALGNVSYTHASRRRARLLKRLGLKNLVELGAWAVLNGFDLLPAEMVAKAARRPYRRVGIAWDDPEQRRIYNRESMRAWRAANHPKKRLLSQQGGAR